MIAAIRQWLNRARRVRELEAEVVQLKATAVNMAVQAERDRALAIMAAASLVKRVGMVLPDDAAGISAGVPAHVFLDQATPRLCGLVDDRPSIH